MGFTSLDDLVAQITAGKYKRTEYAKSTPAAHTAGGWNCLFGANGNPPATTYPSAQDLVYQACTETYGDAIGAAVLGMQHGGNPGGSATKHILNVGFGLIGSSGAPWQAKLVDLVGYYRLSGANVTGTGSRTMINSNACTFDNSGGSLRATYTNDFNHLSKVQFIASGGGVLPTGLVALTDYWIIRLTATTCKLATSFANALAGTAIAYTDAGTTPTVTMMQFPNRYTNGVGCQGFFVVQTAPTGGGPTLSASAYDCTTDTAGAGTRAFQGSPTMGAAADAYANRIIHSGIVAGRYGPFLPLQAGDLGIARLNSFTFSGGTAYTGSGVLAFCIVKPLCDLVIPATGLYAERDLVNQLPSLPKIEDGACLGWLIGATGATPSASPVIGAVDFAWGG